MVTTIHTFAKCGSADIRRNSHSGGHTRYRCRACGYQARFVPATVARAVQYAQVEALSVERNSQRSITGVARMRITKQLKENDCRLATIAATTATKSARFGCGSPSNGPGVGWALGGRGKAPLRQR